MPKELTIERLEAKIGPENEPILTVRAILSERKDQEKSSFAISDAQFQVRLNSELVFEGKGNVRTGILEIDQVLLELNKAKVDVQISADDGIDIIIATVKLDISSIIKEINKRQQKEATESEKYQSVETQLILAIGLINKGSPRGFELLVQYAEFPQIEKFFSRITDKGCEAAIKHYEIYRKVVWSERLVKKAACIEPWLFMYHISMFLLEPWLSEFLVELAKVEPLMVLRKLEEYRHFDFAETVVMTIAKTDPKSVLNVITTFMYMPWGERVTTTVAKMNPSAALKCLQRIKKNSPKSKLPQWVDRMIEFARQELQEWNARKEALDRVEKEAGKDREENFKKLRKC